MKHAAPQNDDTPPIGPDAASPSAPKAPPPGATEVNAAVGGLAPTRAAGPVPISRNAGPAPTPPQVTFNRHELNVLLNLYGRRVAEGEWRDYAIDFLKDRAVFSVFRRTSEMPVYRIAKQPALARRQGAWSVTSAAGLVLKRGNELPRVLAVIERPLRVVRSY